MENMLEMFRNCLYYSFVDWVNHHKDAIGDKWCRKLLREAERSRKNCNTPVETFSHAIWIFSMVSNFGVMAGLSPNRVNLIEVPKGFDGKLTRRVLLNCSACMSLQYLPLEPAE